MSAHVAASTNQIALAGALGMPLAMRFRQWFAWTSWRTEKTRRSPRTTRTPYVTPRGLAEPIARQIRGRTRCKRHPADKARLYAGPVIIVLHLYSNRELLGCLHTYESVPLGPPAVACDVSQRRQNIHLEQRQIEHASVADNGNTSG